MRYHPFHMADDIIRIMAKKPRSRSLYSLLVPARQGSICARRSATLVQYKRSFNSCQRGTFKPSAFSRDEAADQGDDDVHHVRVPALAG